MTAGVAVTPRILVVDDDPAVVSALRRVLLLEGYDVATAQSGEEALAAAKARPPDLVVLDVMLPDVDGLGLCGQLRESFSNAILMISAKDAVSDRIAGLNHGADDYLVKPFALDELTARVRALLRRQVTAGGDILKYAGLRVDTGSRQVFRADQPLKLSPREYDLLTLFLRHPRQALSREQLCQQVWGYAFEGESNFVDVAVKELRKKLESGGLPRLIKTIRGFGYALRED